MGKMGMGFKFQIETGMKSLKYRYGAKNLPRRISTVQYVTVQLSPRSATATATPATRPEVGHNTSSPPTGILVITEL